MIIRKPAIGYLLCVELCQVLVSFVENFIMLPRSRSLTPTNKYAALILRVRTTMLFPPKISVPTLGIEPKIL